MSSDIQKLEAIIRECVFDQVHDLEKAVRKGMGDPNAEVSVLGNGTITVCAGRIEATITVAAG